MTFKLATGGLPHPAKRKMQNRVWGNQCARARVSTSVWVCNTMARWKRLLRLCTCEREHREMCARAPVCGRDLLTLTFGWYASWLFHGTFRRRASCSSDTDMMCFNNTLADAWKRKSSSGIRLRLERAVGGTAVWSRLLGLWCSLPKCNRRIREANDPAWVSQVSFAHFHSDQYLDEEPVYGWSETLHKEYAPENPEAILRLHSLCMHHS